MKIQIYLAGRVRRYHTHPRLAEKLQTDADHSWGVAMLISLNHPNPSRDLLQAALEHDTAVLLVGDIPHNAKPRFPGLSEYEDAVRQHELGLPKRDLSDEDRIWLSWADRVESLLFMGLHQTEWTEEDRHSLLALAERIGMYNQTLELMEKFYV